MGLFGFNREDEFLDEDEKRLIRESKERQRKAHKDCEADHGDDGHFAPPITLAKPHDECKADHSDDNSNARVPSSIPSYIPSNYTNRSVNRMVAVVIVSVTLLTLMVIVGVIISAKDNATSVEEVTTSTSSYSSNISSIDQELLDAINQLNSDNAYSREEMIAELMKLDFSKSDSNYALFELELIHAINFGDNAIRFIAQNDLGRSSEDEIRAELLNHQFTERDIEYALENI